ncbi:MAG: 30S ribosomal protein S20 [Candidatus Kapaibacterium sp.]|jgi:small subunit ribosomal protein S20
MAHHKSAEKRNRQSIKKNAYNRANKKLVKEAVKAVRTATNAVEAEALLIKATSILDKVAARGIMHKNTASNRKSSLARTVNKLKAAAVA